MEHKNRFRLHLKAFVSVLFTIVCYQFTVCIYFLSMLLFPLLFVRLCLCVFCFWFSFISLYRVRVLAARLQQPEPLLCRTNRSSFSVSSVFCCCFLSHGHISIGINCRFCRYVRLHYMTYGTQRKKQTTKTDKWVERVRQNRRHNKGAKANTADKSANWVQDEWYPNQGRYGK